MAFWSELRWVPVWVVVLAWPDVLILTRDNNPGVGELVKYNLYGQSNPASRGGTDNRAYSNLILLYINSLAPGRRMCNFRSLIFKCRIVAWALIVKLLSALSDEWWQSTAMSYDITGMQWVNSLNTLSFHGISWATFRIFSGQQNIFENFNIKRNKKKIYLIL